MERMRKIVKQVVIFGVLVGISGFLGAIIQKEYQEKLDATAETVELIAVVNMDEGLVVDNVQINYASQLVQMPGENFTIAGLTDAKNGIKNGTYAAYIIIPENFSEAVASIQNNPEKIILEYAFNPKLDEEVEKQIIVYNDFWIVNYKLKGNK